MQNDGQLFQNRYKSILCQIAKESLYLEYCIKGSENWDVAKKLAGMVV
jgi:hypothetical protein